MTLTFKNFRGVLDDPPYNDTYTVIIITTVLFQVKMALWKHPGNDITGMIARAQKVAGTFEQLIGGEVYHYHSKVMMKAPRTRGAHVWHQDYG